MGEVISIESKRGQVASRGGARAAAAAGSTHPALRWLAGDVWYLAHRRGDDGGARCGSDGRLSLATGGVPLCDLCFPEQAAAQMASADE